MSHRCNIRSQLLSDQDNESVFNLLGTGCFSMATCVVQLFTVQANKKRHKKWIKKCCGAVCFVKDNLKKSYFLRIYDPKAMQMLWEQELYNKFTYNTPKEFFHTFEAHDCHAGLNFASEDEAHVFKEVIEEKLLERHNRRLERERRRQEIKNAKEVAAMNDEKEDVTNEAGQDESKEDLQQQNDEKKNKYKVDKPRMRKKKKAKRKGLTKDDVGIPHDFRHVSHLSWNADDGPHMDRLDSDMKELLEQIGIKERSKVDKDTMDFIYEFVDRNGGVNAVKEDFVSWRKSTNFSNPVQVTTEVQPNTIPTSVPQTDHKHVPSGIKVMDIAQMKTSLRPTTRPPSPTSKPPNANRRPPSPSCKPLHLNSIQSAPLNKSSHIHTRPPSPSSKPLHINARPPSPSSKPPHINTRPPSPSSKPPHMNTRPPSPISKPPHTNLKPQPFVGKPSTNPKSTSSFSGKENIIQTTVFNQNASPKNLPQHKVMPSVDTSSAVPSQDTNNLPSLSKLTNTLSSPKSTNASWNNASSESAKPADSSEVLQSVSGVPNPNFSIPSNASGPLTSTTAGIPTPPTPPPPPTAPSCPIVSIHSPPVEEQTRCLKNEINAFKESPLTSNKETTDRDILLRNIRSGTILRHVDRSEQQPVEKRGSIAAALMTELIKRKTIIQFSDNENSSDEFDDDWDDL